MDVGPEKTEQLAEIDRQWQIERERYLISGRFGRKCIPTMTAGIITAVGGGAFGLFWTMISVSMPAAGPMFPLFGVLFTLVSVCYGLNAFVKARRYRRAFVAYKARRAAVLAPASPPRGNY